MAAAAAAAAAAASKGRDHPFEALIPGPPRAPLRFLVFVSPLPPAPPEVAGPPSHRVINLAPPGQQMALLQLGRADGKQRSNRPWLDATADTIWSGRLSGLQVAVLLGFLPFGFAFKVSQARVGDGRPALTGVIMTVRGVKNVITPSKVMPQA